MCQVSSQQIAALYPEKGMMGINFTPTHCQRLQRQNKSTEIGLIKLAEPSQTLNYKPLQLTNNFTRNFIVYICV